MANRIRRRPRGLFLLLAMAVALSPVLVEATVSGIVLDGSFRDWSGRDHVADLRGDAFRNQADVVNVSWVVTDGGPSIFWMVERQVPGKQGEGAAGEGPEVFYEVHVDSNDNGEFLEHGDRVVQVHYVPRNRQGTVNITVRYADTRKVISKATDKDWGEPTSAGGGRVEFAASFSDLGIGIGQPVRMFVTSSDGTYEESSAGEAQESEMKVIDRVPDAGEIESAHASVAGTVLLAFVVVTGAAATAYFKRRREWS